MNAEKDPERNSSLDMNLNVTEMVLIHLGKTGGSSITCMMDRSIQKSQTVECGDDTNANHPPSAISRKVVKRIHLGQSPIMQYDAFLILARNPLDRIISWFYYVHPSYPPEMSPKHKRGCHDFAIYDCWDDIQSLSEQGLATSNNQHTVNQTMEECRSWAWDGIRGKRKCWHNYYNYNFTYGNLVRYMEGYNSKTKRSKNMIKKQIFIIRTEHANEDWNNIDIMLGGDGTSIIPQTNKFSHRHLERIKTYEHWGFPIKDGTPPNKTLSVSGRLNLCHALCEEIQIYKKLLFWALNLDEQSRRQSLDELLVSCPNESRLVRECVYNTT